MPDARKMPANCIEWDLLKTRHSREGALPSGINGW